MNQSLVRVCPVCERENAAQALRCGCGASLLGVDFSVPRASNVAGATANTEPETASEPAPTLPPAPAPGVRCPHADCAQPNPPGQARCLYCGRALQPAAAGTQAGADELAAPGAAPLSTRLPVALRGRYRVLAMLPTAGAEADLLRVEELAEAASATPPAQRIVKLYRHGLAGDTELLAKVMRAGSQHVVRFHEQGVSDGVRYEVMEYCPLGSLRTLLAAGPLSVERIRAIVSELAQGLAHVQALQILHRDLKPENVLVRALEPLSLVLTDFGIASLRMATQHFTGGARSTRYAAPEALTGVLDDKADWWSLGMIVLEATLGRHPYDGLSEQVANYHLATKPVDTRGIFHDDLRKLCRGLLLRDPQRRWGATEVRRWLASDPTLPAPEEAALSVALRPYKVADAQCGTAVELAATLAKNWQIGCKDLMRGSLGAWVEHELHDHNLLRTLQDIQERRGVSPDWRLLSFILAAAPDIPAVWQELPISRESLLIAARKSTLGNAKATAWLQSLHTEGVLELLGAAGRNEVASFRQSWLAGLQRFEVLWEQARVAEERWSRAPKAWHGHRGVVVDVDYALYVQPVRMAVPGVERRHGPVLLASNLPAYVSLVRGELAQSLARSAQACPWLAELGPLPGLDAVGVMVVQQLLPLAQEDMAREARQLASSTERGAGSPDVATAGLLYVACQALGVARLGVRSDAQLRELQSALAPAQEASLRLIALPAHDPAFTSFRNAVESFSRAGLELQAALDASAALREVNAIWLQPQRLLMAAGVAMALGVVQIGLAITAAALLGVGVVWRRKLQRQADEQLQTRLKAFIRSGDKVLERQPAGG